MYRMVSKQFRSLTRWGEREDGPGRADLTKQEDGAGENGEDGDDDQTRSRLVKPWDNLIRVQ